MALTRDVVLRLLGDSDSAVAATKAAANEAGVAVTAYKRAERELANQEKATAAAASQRRAAMAEASQGAMILGAAMLAGFGIAAKAAMDFDAAMSGVGAASGATAAQLDLLRAAALDAGKTTAYSATEAANAQTELAKAGVSVTDILNGGLTGALDLAAAGQLGVAEAAGIAAVAMKQFGLSGQDIPHVADLLAAGAGKAMGSVEDLGAALKQAGLVAAATGLNIEETTGTLAAFAANGLIGSDAGTSLKTMLQKLQNPSLEASAAMESLGINMYDANGEFAGMDVLAGQLKTNMAGLTQAERDKAMATIFGSDAVRAANVLYKEGSAGIQQWTEAVDDAGYAQEQAAKLTDNLRGDIERLGGAITDVLIGGGSEATGVLRFLTQGLTEAVGAIGNLPGPLQAAGMGILGVAGAGTLMLGIVGSMIPKIAAARVALVNLGTTGAAVNTALGLIGKGAGVASLALAAVAAAGYVFDQLIEDFEPVEREVDKLAEAFKEFGETGKLSGEGAKAFGADVSGIIADMQATAPAISSVSEELAFMAGVLDENGDWQWGNFWTADPVTHLKEDLNEMNGAFQQSQIDIEAADEALAGLVSNGSAEAAAKSIVRMAEAWVESGGTMDEFRRKFPGAIAALEQYQRTSDIVVTDTGEIETAMGEAASASEVLKEAIDQLNGVAMSNVDANIQWTQTLADLKIAAENGSATLDINTKSGADNAEQFVTAAQRASEFAQTVADTSGIEAGRAKLDELKATLIDQAEAAGFDRGEVELLIDQILKVPEDTPTTITLNDNATPGIAAVDSALNTINGKTVTTYVRNVVTTIYESLIGGAKPINDVGSGGNPIGLPPVRRASGGQVAGGGLAWVGERGPELVRFGAAGFVTPADLSRHAQAAAASSLTPTAAPATTVINNRTFAPVFQMTAARPVTAREAMDVARDYEWLHGA